jgi:hypothetical protein
MFMDAMGLRDSLLSFVGDAFATDGWDDAVLGEALSQGLADTNAWLPPQEATHRVETAGYEQDLSALSPLQVLAVAYPWKDDRTFRECAVTWRMVGPTTIRLDGRKMVTGELLRVRFRKRCTVAGIDGATTTNLPANAEHALLLAAASHAYLIRYRQLSRRPSSAPTDLTACKELADLYRKRFEGEMVLSGEPNPVWEMSEP